jgi:integrase
MKGRVEHTVPLPPQALAILEAAKSLQYQRQMYVFPGLRPKRPLSENTFNVTLRSMGYTAEHHVAHGFRSSASTLLHSLGFDPDVIEFQLAHKRKGVAGVYNRWHLMPERTAMMTQWADHLDRLRRQ